MRKLLLSFFLLLASLLSFSQAWQVTNIIDTSNYAITDIEVHNGELYAVVASSTLPDFYKLDPISTSWSPVNSGSVTYTPLFMESAGGRVYMATKSGSYSRFYSSEDNMASFQTITYLPFAYGALENPACQDLQVLQNMLLVSFGEPYHYWARDTADTHFNGIGDPYPFYHYNDPLVYMNGKYFVFNNLGGQVLKVSNDTGYTWQTISNNLPYEFYAIGFYGDYTTNRLYIWGSWNGGPSYGLFYSDDEGSTWTEIDISQFRHLTTSGGITRITSFFAEGQTIYFGMENQAANTPPNLVGSFTGIANLAEDTTGLLIDTTRFAAPSHFMFYQGKLAMLMDSPSYRVYLRDITVGSEEASANVLENIDIYPNPATNELFINSSAFDIESIDIINALGQTIISEAIYADRINVSELTQGIYFIRFNSASEVIGTKRFVKK